MDLSERIIILVRQKLVRRGRSMGLQIFDGTSIVEGSVLVYVDGSASKSWFKNWSNNKF